MLPSAHAPGPPHHPLRRHRPPHHRRHQPALPPRDGAGGAAPASAIVGRIRGAVPDGDHHRPRVRRRRPRRLRAPRPEDGGPLLGSPGRRRHDPGPGLRGRDARRRTRGGGPGARGHQRPRAARPSRGQGRPHRAPPVAHRQAQRPGPIVPATGSRRPGIGAGRPPGPGCPRRERVRATRIARAGSRAAARPPRPGPPTRSPATSATRAPRADPLAPLPRRPRTCASVTPPASMCA